MTLSSPRVAGKARVIAGATLLGSAALFLAHAALYKGFIVDDGFVCRYL